MTTTNARTWTVLPVRFIKFHGNARDIKDENGNVIGFVFDTSNAELAAASPDLLAALIGLNRGPSDDWCFCPDSFEQWLWNAEEHHPNCAAVRAAIAKAKGEKSQ